MADLNIAAPRKFKLLCSVAAVAVLSACASVSTVPIGPTAGAPSTHIPQTYENLGSAAPTTSTLGGSTAVTALATIGGWLGGQTSVSASGSFDHGTGRLELDDGTYLFVDVDGPDAAGNVSDGAGGATGAVEAVLATTYTYVTDYELNYTTNGIDYYTLGVAGIVTSASDMPSAGSATYSGDAFANSLDTTTTVTTNDFNLFGGVSTVVADFGAGTATVNLGSFATKLGTGAQTFDQIQGSGIVISGAKFTGGTWVTMLNGNPVNAVGASISTTSNGTFFAYDPNISAPAEVGGVVTILGATDVITGVYIAAAQ